MYREVAADPAFAEALLREGIDTMLTGEVDTGKAILRDYIKATILTREARRGDRHAAERPDPACSDRAAIPRPAILLQRDRLSAKASPGLQLYVTTRAKLSEV